MWNVVAAYEHLATRQSHCLGIVPGTVSEGLNGWSEALTVGLLAAGWTTKL